MRGRYVIAALLLGAAALAEETEARKPRVVTLAVIVHPKNPVTELSLAELRAILKLERQFWPNGKRAVLYLRPSESDEHRVLLERVYRMSNERLQKYWVAKLFAGEIPAKPSYVPTAEAAGSRVRESEGAISFVRADEVPKDVRVLVVDKLEPGEKGYPLTLELPPPSP